MADLFERLAALGVAFDRVDHPPVFTVDEATRLVPPLHGARTKNLFVRDKSGRRHYLVTVGHGKAVDLKALARTVGVPSLSFGSPDRLKRHLGIEPGSVSLLAVVNDAIGAVEVIVDRELWASERIRCHPLVNTATLSIPRADLERFLDDTGHPPRVMDVPGREDQ
jgi:Ala-tRNA(Pro) deacylase